MRIDGRWLLRDDGVTEPVIRGEIPAADGSWVATEFLVDVGADHSAISADTLVDTGLKTGSPLKLSGVGGQAGAAVIETTLRLQREDTTWVTFKGQFAACLSPESLDTSVLGRDILNLFAVIVDRPQGVICLLSQRHRYVIVEQ
jgi:hypothetical protein